MPKRVYELAKELDVKSKVLVDKLNNLLKIDAKNHMTLLEDEEVDKVLVLFGIKTHDEVEASEKEEVSETKVEAKEVKAEEKKTPKDVESEVKRPIEKKQKSRDNNKKQSSTKQKQQKNDENMESQLNIKMDKGDEILIEKYLEDEEKTNKVQKIGSKNKRDNKNIKNNFSRRRNKGKQQAAKPKQEPVLPKKIKVREIITVKDLAEKLRRSANDVIKKLLMLGIMATINQELDFDTATLVGIEFGVDVELEHEESAEEKIINSHEDKDEDLESRAPIVVVMGHVDHGKTSLLDAIRETNVIANEAGGITQHIGAYRVNVQDRKITFLDTPGHAAFTAMRARGAEVTDIAIIVVAADDSIMPQTIEAINHAKAAGVSIIIAINKIDKPDANVERVKQDLSQHGLLVEDWGGDIIAVPISAKTGANIDQLLEMVLLSADMLELKANPNRPAKGTVIESKLDKGRGPVATVLVQNGTLNSGDTIIVGNEYGRIRAMIDDNGKRVKKAKPSVPVEILGLSGVPKAGDDFYVAEDEKMARQVAETRRIKTREENIGSTTKVSLDQLFEQIQQNELKELNIIVKADVQGSVEAVKQSLEKLSDEEVRVKVIHTGVGAVNESDVILASASNAIIIGFNVRPESSATSVAERENVDIRLYRIIYNAIEDIQAAMKGMLDPKFKEEIVGHAEVREIFKFSSVGNIAGCYVTDGKIIRNGEVRLVRDGIVIFEGELSSLKRFKDDAKEVQTGYECGITLEKFNDIKQGDIFECYVMKEIER